MAVASSTIAAYAAVTAAAGTIASGVQQRKAAKASRKAERKARRVENAVAGVENQRNIRRRVAEQRVESANLTQQGEAAGVSGSSSLVGAVGSSLSTAAGDIGFANTRIGASRGAAAARDKGVQKAGSALAKASLFSNAASIGSTFANVDTVEAVRGL